MMNDEYMQHSDSNSPMEEEKTELMVEEDAAIHEQAAEKVLSDAEGENMASDEITQEDDDTADDDSETSEVSEGEIGADDAEKNARDFELFRVMPYIDLMNERSRVKSSKEELESIKSMFDHVGDMDKADAAMAGLVAQMDEANKAGMRSSIKEFYETYPKTKHEAERLEELVNGCISLYEDVGRKSAAFMMQSMRESLDARITTMENAAPEERVTNFDMVLKRLKVIRDCYANPVDFSMLFNKLAFPANTINLYKAFKKDGPDAAMRIIEKTFDKVFNDKFMKSFRHIFREIITPNLDPSYNQGAVDVMIFFLTYWLAAQYEKEYTSGKSAQVRTFVMDVYFMDKYGAEDEIFNLPGGREYFGTVCYALFMIMTATCSDSLTMKTANQEIPELLRATLDSMKADYERCVSTHPGTTYTGTSIARYFDNAMTIDDVLRQTMKEDNDMSNLENQGTPTNPVCTNLGQRSVDPSIMPEDVDNMDADMADESTDPATEDIGQTPYGPNDEAPAKTTTPVG